tara:strand:- start:133520 stop:133681 length:162 start_codon:yes stop_codon:yes gene_type:complete
MQTPQGQALANVNIMELRKKRHAEYGVAKCFMVALRQARVQFMVASRGVSVVV